MKNSTGLGLGVLLGAALLVGSSGANAALITDDWTWTSASGSGSGVLTYDTSNTSGGPGVFEVVGMAGTINALGDPSAEVITFVPNPSYPNEILSPTGFFLYDDSILPTSNPLVLNGGLLFDASGWEWNIFSTGPSAYTIYNNSGANEGGVFALSASPLPATWTMLIAGLLGLGFVAYRGTKKGSAALAAA